MATLETTFAGLKLKNPIIVSSSGLTDNAVKNQKLCEAGAGAIVLKSLFEEQIRMEADQLGDPQDLVSFSEPHQTVDSKAYETVSKYLYKWFKSES